RFPLEKLSLFSPLFSARQSVAQGVSPPAGGDKGLCPLTPPGLLALDLASCAQLDQQSGLPFFWTAAYVSEFFVTAFFQ
ncbi:MAG: hypothetical protein ACI4XB_03525, partial [Ruminococcus sp.]